MTEGVQSKKLPFTIDNILSVNGHNGEKEVTSSLEEKVSSSYPIKFAPSPSASISSLHDYTQRNNLQATLSSLHQHRMTNLLFNHHQNQQNFRGFGEDLNGRPCESRSPDDNQLKSVKSVTNHSLESFDMNANKAVGIGIDPYRHYHHQLHQSSINLSHRHPDPHLNSSSSLSLSPCSSQSPLNVHQVHPSILGISGPPGSGVTFSWVSPPKCLPRKRTVFSRYQRNELERKFEAQKYISKTERLKFARELGLKDSQVKVWFINRRTKWRNDREKRVRKQAQQT